MTAIASAARSFFAPEIVQTSAMDCGPAALKCLMEGFGLPVSYGRLREACQTDVDGTSIDMIEVVANDLGLVAEQTMLPPEHLLGPGPLQPCIVVTRQSSGPTHFVVVWRRVGAWLQIMDPAAGRRWVRARRFLHDVYDHTLSVAADDWRAWAGSPESRATLLGRFASLGVGAARAEALIAEALSDAGWFPVAALDASLRLATALLEAGGLARGEEAARLAETVFRQTCANVDDIHALVPADYWTVAPDPEAAARGERRLVLRGAVMLRIDGRAAAPRPADAPQLSRELHAALAEKPVNPLGALWRLLASDGLLAPLALAGALGLAAAAVLLEALLFRGLFDLGALLNIGGQRLAAVASLLVFLILMLALRWPIGAESMRFGRRLDTRLRMALLAKLPRLTDGYFQSRAVSDMADRAHALHLLRATPALGVQAVQTVCELALTLGGVALIDPAAALLACGLVIVAVAIPLLLQPLVSEADLRVRSHAAALNGVHLDALLGVVPVRVHRAEAAVTRVHESLLVDWSRAATRLARASLLVEGVQQSLCLGLAGLILALRFQRLDAVSGADLLLVYWILKLPAIGQSVVNLALQYPAQRNVLLRLLEPLAAPEAPGAASPHRTPLRTQRRPVGIEIENGALVAAGHRILSDIDLVVRPGEHVAIVGPSGAGKSSLLGLFLGWRGLASGRLLVDGAEPGASELDELRRRTAWVDPGVQLWNRSLLENLAFSAPEASMARVGVVLEAAHLRGVLQRLPGGLQASLGDGGAALSGGEGQRVRLARALMQSRPDLVLLDEPFRGMDREVRAQLLADVRHYWAAATLLCVSHDIEETRAFARVLVVEDGRIVEDGAPERLMGQRSRYRAFYEAERHARESLWRGRQWRRLRIEDGHVAHVD